MTNEIAALVLVLIFIIAVLLFILRIVAKVKAKNLEQQHIALVQVQILKNFLSSVQTHRGLTTRFLTRDIQSMESIIREQKKASEMIAALEAYSSHSIKYNGNWQAITEHWSRLSSRFKKESLDNNINQHSALVLSITSFIYDVAKANQLFSIRSRKSAAMRCLWEELLVANEYIGQARVLGVAVLTMKEDKSSARHKLKRIATKVSESCKVAWLHSEPGTEQKALLDWLLEMLNTQLQADEPTLDPDVYFSRCTELMDLFYAQYDSILDDLKQR